jgi:hypothetical protein
LYSDLLLEIIVNSQEKAALCWPASPPAGRPGAPTLWMFGVPNFFVIQMQIEFSVKMLCNAIMKKQK